MKLEMQMTERDKKLLLFLGLFVIIVCFGWWGIRPALKSIKEINKSIDAAQDAKYIVDMKISELPLIEKDNEFLEEDIVNARSDFYPMMTSSDIDKMMTGMALDYSLYAYDLSIDVSDNPTSLSAYKYSQKYEDDLEEARQAELERAQEQMYDEEEDTTYSDMYAMYTAEVEDITYDAASTGIHTAKVSMRVGGTEENLQSLINDLSRTEKKLRLTSYEWDKVSKTSYSKEIDDYEVEQKYILYITIEFYMCEE